jgi:hypothetical protein
VPTPPLPLTPPAPGRRWPVEQGRSGPRGGGFVRVGACRRS